MRTHLSLSVAALVAASSASAQDTALEARIRRVENGLLTPVVVAGTPGQGAGIADRMRALNTPAVSIAVINDGRIEWARAYGVLEAGGAPADTATLFQAASISKPVATVGALLLVQRGDLSLDADVNTALRSWRVPENAFTAREKVTLRRLLSHGAGLTVSGFPGYPSGAPLPTTVQILDGQAPANTAPVRVDTLPGSLTRYSGGGMTVMQLMVEDVTGRPLAAYLGEAVLRPLGMMHSSYDLDVAPDRAARTARGHDRRGTPVPGGWNRYPETAAAGLWTTPSDLARYLIAVRRAAGGQAVGSLTPDVARQMLTPQPSASGGGFGLGLQLDRMGTPAASYGHTGSNRGYRAQMLLFPERGQGVVIMTNSDAGSDLGAELVRALAREYGWPRFQPVEKTAAALDPAALAGVPGRYQSAGDNPVTLEFTVRDGRLEGAGANWPAPRVLYPLSATEPRFFIRELDREFTFERDDAGRVVRLRVTGGGAPELVAQRVD
ncbi:serine hydrolase domain-containing protein [Longimicrobium sp.]|uniref:serine hydrolase domain-containing protein n=1 Tax=Longimicrobium sp. TaxID=2029185 RepID=UPI002E326D46|nr:serine hydrolase domain-containing protein [Longimicrobium sp.]HEX6039072.1 serine hydrolase domain-containing protein [Longimicrobium sp.]